MQPMKKKNGNKSHRRNKQESNCGENEDVLVETRGKTESNIESKNTASQARPSTGLFCMLLLMLKMIILVQTLFCCFDFSYLLTITINDTRK